MTAVRGSLPGYRPVPAGDGAMLAGMAACPPAPDSDAPAVPALHGWQLNGTERAAELRESRHATATTVGSPAGQVRALAWLLGLRAPALSAYTCSWLAAGASGAGDHHAALYWLTRAGLSPAAAGTVAGLVWPRPSRAAGGAAGEARPAGRAGSRRRPVDVGLGAAGSTTK